MPNDKVTKLIQLGEFDDQLTGILRNGARALLAKAVEAEVADFLGQHADLKTEDGQQRVVRHGHLPEHEVMTVSVRSPYPPAACARSRPCKNHAPVLDMGAEIDSGGKMAHVEGKSRYQATLYPETLDEVIAADSSVRVIDGFVDSLDLAGPGFSKVEAEATGRPPYDPRDLLKL